MAQVNWMDLTIFFGSLVAVMAVGLWYGRKEETSEDYFLAGKKTRWWGVAGSIFGTNVSAGHLVGMMGVGFGAGFAQSHFELGAIAGLMLLAYGFLPVYRKLNLYTLSEYLERRYDARSRVMYAIAMIFIMVVIQMVPGFYIGSRSLNILLMDEAPAAQTAPAAAADAAQATASVAPADADQQTLQVQYRHYVYGILLMAFVTAAYTIAGGLKAVIITDVLQSVLMLVAGLTVAFLTFNEIGGWDAMRAIDAAADLNGPGKMHLYLPADHPELPWTGVLSGLFLLHFFYWSTNQFIVQRTLSAVSDREARLGILTAGFFKLLIPFFSIGTGIAAFYYFKQKNIDVHQDAVFVALLKYVVAPVGYGVVGLIAAGLVGAILSSIDSMMNSAATLITFDLYKKFLRPDASEKQLIWVGRIWIIVFVSLAALLAIFTMDPNSKTNFFLVIKDQEAAILPALLVPFAAGMLWKRATATGAIAAMIAGWIFSFGLPPLWARHAPGTAAAEWFGDSLNFMHNALIASVAGLCAMIAVSLAGAPPRQDQADCTWTHLGGHDAGTLKRTAGAIGLSLGFYAILGLLIRFAEWPPVLAAVAASVYTLAVFMLVAFRQARAAAASGPCTCVWTHLICNDKTMAGVLAGLALFMMFYFV